MQHQKIDAACDAVADCVIFFEVARDGVAKCVKIVRLFATASQSVSKL